MRNSATRSNWRISPEHKIKQITGSGIKPHSGIVRIRQISVRKRTSLFLIAGHKKRTVHLHGPFHMSGDGGTRTHGLLVANEALSQLSYAPIQQDYTTKGRIIK